MYTNRAKVIYQPNEDAIPLDLPDNVEAIGCLFKELADNDDEDILQVTLPNGFGIDVGNYCRGIHPYSLHIVAFQNNDFHDQLNVWDTTSPETAAKIVEAWCKEKNNLQV